MTYAKPWHMPRILCGRLVRQKDGHSEGPGQSGPIQTVPESLVQCHRGISARNRNNWEKVHTLLFCYTLSRPKTHQVFGDCTMGYGTSASSAIPSILFCSSSCLFCLLIHPRTPFPPTFHISELHFVSCFHSTSHFHSPCSIFRSPIPDPDICSILITLICPLPI